MPHLGLTTWIVALSLLSKEEVNNKSGFGDEDQELSFRCYVLDDY